MKLLLDENVSPNVARELARVDGIDACHAAAREVHRVHPVDGMARWFVAGEHFDDERQSGTSTERSGLEKLLTSIEDGEIQRVIVYRLDRLTRRSTDWAKLAGAFERHDVGLTVVHGAIDAEAGSLQRLQLNVLASFAEMEREMIAERLADARRARKARGKRSSGRVPLGYASDPRTQQLVVVPDEARTARWLFKAAASGKSPAEIAIAANTRRLPNKAGKTGTWAPRTMLRILQNPVYVARRPDGTPAAHVSVIAPDTARRSRPSSGAGAAACPPNARRPSTS